MVIHCIEKELSLRKDYLSGETVNTIYFGGGTPSLMSAKQLNGILDVIYKHYQVDLKELTMELNPEDINDQVLSVWQDCGVNRLSIGVQTFDDQLLQSLNRCHNAQQAYHGVVTCFERGFENMNIDLIYGIHKSNSTTWEKDLQLLEQLPVKHLSAYNLTIEENTVFGRMYEKGELPEVDEELSVAQYDRLKEVTSGMGLEHYEISNFGMPGYYSQHNSGYWKDEKFLGIGPSAHSYNRTHRHINVAHNLRYINAIKEGKLPFTTTKLERKDKINEYLLTSLRTIWGCDTNILTGKYDYHIEEDAAFHQYVDCNYMLKENDIIYLTEQGKLFADKIIGDLFVL